MLAPEQGKDRIKLEMSTIDLVMAMSEGNPGAVRVIMEVLKNGPAIDPDGAMGGFGALLMFDAYRFYGSKIWMLYKDLCGQDLTKTLGVVRAMQLGIVDSRVVHKAIGDDYTPGTPEVFDLEDALAKVRAELPAFGQAPP